MDKNLSKLQEIVKDREAWVLQSMGHNESDITFLPRSNVFQFHGCNHHLQWFWSPPKIKSATVSTVSPSIYFPWSDGTRCHDLRFLNVELLANFFIILFHLHQEAFEFLFTFCHQGGVICISEVIDFSPGNLDSSLCFIQPGISHDLLCIKVR